MKSRIIRLFACLAFLAPVTANAQCAGAFGNSTASMAENCSVTGSSNFVVTVAYVDDSTFTILGLWSEPTLLLTAHVDCGTMTFHIDSTAFSTFQFHIRGSGSVSGNIVSMAYSVGQVGVPGTIDVCTGSYTGFSVGTQTARPLNISLWPNPSTDFTNVLVPGVERFTASLFTLQGQMVSRADVHGPECEISLAELAPSTYLLVIQTEDGNTATRRIVRQ